MHAECFHSCNPNYQWSCGILNWEHFVTSNMKTKVSDIFLKNLIELREWLLYCFHYFQYLQHLKMLDWREYHQQLLKWVGHDQVSLVLLGTESTTTCLLYQTWNSGRVWKLDPTQLQISVAWNRTLFMLFVLGPSLQMDVMEISQK